MFEKFSTLVVCLFCLFSHLYSALEVRISTPKNKEQSVILDKKFNEYARKKNQSLETSCYFDREFLKEVKNVRLMLHEKDKGERFFVTTTDNVVVYGTFFDRNSKELLVIGPGFPVPREKMAPFLLLFPDYDLVIFDYRGQGLDHANVDYSLSSPISIVRKFVHTLCRIDFNASRLGLIEEKDVIAVVAETRKRKSYTQVFGLGLCYSAYIFAKAAALSPNLFDKLILDGSWPTIAPVIDEIIKYPLLICAKQPPRSPCLYITNQKCWQYLMQQITQALVIGDFKTMEPISTHLQGIRCPILFFQCRNDCYCSLSTFEELWSVTQGTHVSYKAVIFTDNLHGRNHMHQCAEYKELANWFLRCDQDSFVQNIMSVS